MQAIFQADARGFKETSLEELITFRWIDYQLPDDERLYAHEIIEATLVNIDAIDAQISERLVNWELTRISAVSRAILRTGIAQLIYLPKSADAAVVIDEAILLAKQYDALEAAAFINGLLDDLVRSTTKAPIKEPPKPKPLATKIKIKKKTDFEKPLKS